MKKFICFVLLTITILFSFASCDNVENNIENYIYNGSMTDWVTFGDNYIYSRIEGKASMTNITTGKSYELVRDPFFKESNEAQIIKYIFSDEKFVYYLLCDSNSRYEIIRQDHKTLEKSSIFKKVIYKEQREILFGIANTMRPKRSDYLNDNIPNRFAVFENCLFLFENTQITEVNLTTKKEKTILKQNIYNGNYSYYNGILYFISDSYDIYAYQIQTGTLKKAKSLKCQNLLVTPYRIYFSSASDKGRLYQMDFNFSNQKLCVAAAVVAMDYNNDRLFYLLEGDDSVYSFNFYNYSIKKEYSLDGVFDMIYLKEKKILALLYNNSKGEFGLKYISK